MLGEVRGDELVPVGRRLQRYPDQAHLRAAVGVERDQGSVGTLPDEIPGCVVQLHDVFDSAAWRFIPGRDTTVARSLA
ncbi:hypothetical protein [Mycobacterium sp. 050134]|uniref:hypothetical protein n=1 Tax=Mycobacterium sp. 050134 TaxID=3096111 RepID=UPI002ED812EA